MGWDGDGDGAKWGWGWGWGVYIQVCTVFVIPVNDAITQHPINIHIPFSATAPLYTTHCNARHCGVATINIDIINPVTVSGTHNRTYRCAATKCATIHIQYNIAPFASVRTKSEQSGSCKNIFVVSLCLHYCRQNGDQFYDIHRYYSYIAETV